MLKKISGVISMICVTIVSKQCSNTIEDGEIMILGMYKVRKYYAKHVCILMHTHVYHIYHHDVQHPVSHRLDEGDRKYTFVPRAEILDKEV